MYSKELEITLSQALSNARKNRNPYLTVEHIFLLLLDNLSATWLLTNIGADIEKLKSQTIGMLATLPAVEGLDPVDVKISKEFQLIIQSLKNDLLCSKNSIFISGADFLIKIVEKNNSLTSILMDSHGITKNTFIDRKFSRSDKLGPVSRSPIKKSVYTMNDKNSGQFGALTKVQDMAVEISFFNKDFSEIAESCSSIASDCHWNKSNFKSDYEEIINSFSESIIFSIEISDKISGAACDIKHSSNRIIDKILLEIEVDLLQKNINVVFTENIRMYLIKSNISQQIGFSYIESKIKNFFISSIDNELNNNRLLSGGSATIDINACSYL